MKTHGTQFCDVFEYFCLIYSDIIQNDDQNFYYAYMFTQNNVKEFFACGEDRELKWDFKKRYAVQNSVNQSYFKVLLLKKSFHHWLVTEFVLYTDFVFFFLPRYNDETNNEMTDFIKISVKGIVPDVSNEVLDGKSCYSSIQS